MAFKIIHSDGRTGELQNPSEQLEVYRHSTSHLMAAAVTSLFPGTHLGIGPAISDGFYYDFQNTQSFSEEDLKKIEDRMREMIAQDIRFEPRLVSKEEAVDLFRRL